MRLRDTRLFCRFQKDPTAVPVIIRERSIKEDTFEALALVGISCPHPVAMIVPKEITLLSSTPTQWDFLSELDPL